MMVIYMVIPILNENFLTTFSSQTTLLTQLLKQVFSFYNLYYSVAIMFVNFTESSTKYQSTRILCTSDTTPISWWFATTLLSLLRDIMSKKSHHPLHATAISYVFSTLTVLLSTEKQTKTMYIHRFLRKLCKTNNYLININKICVVNNFTANVRKMKTINYNCTQSW